MSKTADNDRKQNTYNEGYVKGLSDTVNRQAEEIDRLNVELLKVDDMRARLVQGNEALRTRVEENERVIDALRIRNGNQVFSMEQYASDNLELRTRLASYDKAEPEHSELGLLIIQGLKEAVEHFEGKQTGVKVTAAEKVEPTIVRQTWANVYGDGSIDPLEYKKPCPEYPRYGKTVIGFFRRDHYACGKVVRVLEQLGDEK